MLHNKTTEDLLQIKEIYLEAEVTGGRNAIPQIRYAC